MSKIYFKTAHGLGNNGGANESAVFSRNHFAGLASYSEEVRTQISDWGLTRVAGNNFVCPADRSYWSVSGGRLLRLVGDEIDSGQSIQAAPRDHPDKYIANLMADFSFD